VFTVTRGEVQLLRGENYLAAAPGVEVKSADIIETGKAAFAQVDMEDGSILKLGPDTRVALSDYKLDGNKSVVSATLDVLSGWLRFAVAKLKPQGKYSFNTPVLTVGVRGTEGTIEAANEQGGLHLEEGAVDVMPAGPDMPSVQPLRVTSGEFIQRLRGQPLAKLPQAPPGFQKRLPPIMQEKLSRRADALKERGVPPKVIRQITREDAKRMLDRHPHMQEKLRERFKTPLGSAGAKERGAGLKDTQSEKEPNKPAGFGGQILRERQMKTGKPSDANDVAEGLRRRMQQKQLQGQQPQDTTPADPGMIKRPIVTQDAGTLQKPDLTPTGQPTLREQPVLQPTKPIVPLSPTLQRLPTTEQKSTEQKPAETTETIKTPILQQQSPLLMQRQTISK
ncbi:MAG TPA: FecR family protein, partial [Burkholderiales bacterium]|nr:FecR family protein [Burkholderiales bacterium]